MRPERWSEIERLYEAALKRAPGEREAFLREACNGDEEVRCEVEALFEREEQAREFLESPAVELAARELAQADSPSLIGKEIGAYRVLSLLDRGGMGEVYLAKDERLDRKVALKFLPTEMQQDETARRRFLREARSAAALDHPFICHIHEIGELEGMIFIAMEFVEGQTLDQRLYKGPLPLKEALEKATELAEALEVAHKRHIVHRDLKPSNIMLTPDGHVKVMDFGLAKRLALGEDGGSRQQTMGASLSQTGMTLGTLAYMSPEQLRGEAHDTRSDIFSFGIVLYEMLTGKHPFKKSEAVETGHAILTETPAPLAEDFRDAPVLLQHTVMKMLAKEPERRYQHVGDVRIDLEELISLTEKPSDSRTGKMGAPASGGSQRKVLPWLVSGVLSVAAVVLAVLHFGEVPEASRTVRFPVYLPQELSFRQFDIPAISPDGRHVAFTGETAEGVRLLWVRSLDSLDARPLTGTDGAYAPFWSPDGRLIAFLAGERLKTIEYAGGPAETLCDAPMARGGSWHPNGTILFGTRRGGLYRVSDTGGAATPVTTPDESRGELSHRWPWFLPDGRHFLYTVEGPRAEEGTVHLGSLDSESGEKLLSDYSNAVYLQAGYLLFVREDSLMALPFDAGNLQIGDQAFPVVEPVGGVLARGHGQFAASLDGVLVYNPGLGLRERQLVWVDREGKEAPLAAEPRSYAWPRLSPDGARVAVTIRDRGNSDVWIFGPTGSTRLTFDPYSDFGSTWAPDGQRVAFGSSRGGGQPNLYWKAADGTGQVARLTTSPYYQVPFAFSPDGKALAFSVISEKSYELHLLTMEREYSSRPLLQTRYSGTPSISPDGNWLAYTSDESGGYEVYVRPFPNVDEGSWQISRGGGQEPVWGTDGRELFYRTRNQMMVVRIRTEPSFLPESPQILFTGNYLYGPGRQYDISADGQRFVMIKEVEQTEETTRPSQLVIVIDWLQELKRLAPTRD